MSKDRREMRNQLFVVKFGQDTLSRGGGLVTAKQARTNHSVRAQTQITRAKIKPTDISAWRIRVN